MISLLLAFNRTAAIEPNLGSPISSLCETDRIDRTVNYGTPIRMDDSNSEPALDNSSTKLRGNRFVTHKVLDSLIIDCTSDVDIRRAFNV